MRAAQPFHHSRACDGGGTVGLPLALSAYGISVVGGQLGQSSQGGSSPVSDAVPPVCYAVDCRRIGVTLSGHAHRHIMKLAHAGKATCLPGVDPYADGFALGASEISRIGRQ